MLNPETTKQSDAIEVLFCEPFEKLERFPMSTELTQDLVRLYVSKNIEIAEDEKPFLFRLIEKRVKHLYTFEIQDHRLILFLCILTESPGKAVMYLTYLQYWCKKNNVTKLTFDVFCEKIFPHGFPKESDLDELWNKQKVEPNGGNDNLLDYHTALTSIQI